MQMRENGKHNNVGFNTWLEILPREHLPPKLHLEREWRLEIQRESNEEKDKDKKPRSRENIAQPSKQRFSRQQLPIWLRYAMTRSNIALSSG